MSELRGPRSKDFDEGFRPIHAPASNNVLRRSLGDELAGLLAQIKLTEEGTTGPAPDPGAAVSPTEPHLILARICRAFGLSMFERATVLAAAGMELDDGFVQSLADAMNGSSTMPTLTFGGALSCFPEPHWSALSPSSPLRRWRLIELGSGSRLIDRPIGLSERVLHALAGVDGWDPAVEVVAREIRPPRHWAPSHQRQANALACLWVGSSPEGAAGVSDSIAMLCGRDALTRRAVAAVAGASLGLRVCTVEFSALPSRTDERDELARRWDRDAALNGAALCLEVSMSRGQEAIDFIERLSGPVVVSCDEPPRAGARPRVRIDVEPPNRDEQAGLWRSVLGGAAPSYASAIAGVADQFSLEAGEMYGVAAALAAQPHVEDPAVELWNACRVQSRPRLDGLAERVVSPSGWKDLVLPGASLSVLRVIAAQVRQRRRVYEEWGFGHRGVRGLGVTALFSGPSGTGKTLAAEVLANALDLDLYRIELSGVVSKYIGETEKNLQQVFDAAEAGGVVLLFDEADALFGKRSEVKDARDRHANIEVGYLLQRMESFRGLAILTTNMRAAIDDAFLRRIRFAVEFPFPDAAQRSEIWENAFPAETPTEALDIERLAAIQLCGGNIRNVALNAAFLAAEASRPVSMEHIFDSARAEFVKLERPFSVPRASASRPSTSKPPTRAVSGGVV